MSDITWFPYAVGLALCLYGFWIAYHYRDPDRDAADRWGAYLQILRRQKDAKADE